MIVSEVGRMTYGSSSFLPPACGRPTRELRREALDVLGLLREEAQRDSSGK